MGLGFLEIERRGHLTFVAGITEIGILNGLVKG